MNKIPKVYIVILNWNGTKDTVECLKSVSRLSVVGYQLSVVVVDNASTDNSVSQIHNFLTNNESQITNNELIVNQRNLGFAEGNNVGIKYALQNKADYVMILNNDTMVHPDLMTRFIEAARTYPNAGVFSPKIYFAPGFEFHKDRYKKSDLGKVIWYVGGVIDWNNVYGSTRGVDEIDRGQYDKTQETDFATGACMIMTRKLLQEVGMFDKKYFMYYEDTDLSIRAKKAGFKVMYVPKAILWHKVAQSSGIGSGLNDYFTTRNRMLFGMKYASLRTKLALTNESIKLLLNGRKWQRVGVRDFYLGRMGKGSWV